MHASTQLLLLAASATVLAAPLNLPNAHTPAPVCYPLTQPCPTVHPAYGSPLLPAGIGPIPKRSPPVAPNEPYLINPNGDLTPKYEDPVSTNGQTEPSDEHTKVVIMHDVYMVPGSDNPVPVLVNGSGSVDDVKNVGFNDSGPEAGDPRYHAAADYVNEMNEEGKKAKEEGARQRKGLGVGQFKRGVGGMVD